MSGDSTKKDGRVLALPGDATRTDGRVLPLPPGDATRTDARVLALPGPVAQADSAAPASRRASAEVADTEPHAPPAAAASAPRRIGGYEVVRELARGGMGVVYLARSVRLGRPVALKVLLSGAHAGPDEVERFLVEARAAARLRHPGIVAIHEADRDGTTWFLAMDLIDGESLRAKVSRDGPLPPRTAATHARDVARALQYAHERGVLHRDVKPHNVLVDATGAAFLTDFGLAKEVEREGITATGDVLGTPAYMPPEQASGDRARIDRRSDVYSLGAMLYELVTGRPPFQAPTTLQMLRAVLEDEPVPPSRLRPGLGRDLETVILTCLAKDPARRYDTAGLLADDLDRVVKDEPVRARRAGLLERGLRIARKHRRLVLGLTLLAVTGAVVADRAARDVAVRAEREERARRRDEARAAAEASASRYRTSAPGRAKLRAAQATLDAARRWRALAPDEPAALRGRSDAAFELGDQARHLEEWTGARDAYTEAGECALERERAAAAVRFCDDLFEVRALLGVRDYARAMARLSACVARPGCFTEAWMLRGSLFASFGEREGALADFNHVIGEEPHHVAARLARASLRLELGQRTDALEDIEVTLADDPRNLYARLLEGTIHRARQDPPRAVASYVRLIELDPESARPRLMLGETLADLGDLEGARTVLRRARELAPDDAHIAVPLLRVELALGNHDTAPLVELVSRSPDLEEAAVVLAEQRGRQAGDLAGAVALLDRFLARHPGFPRALAQRALLRLDQKDLAGAAADAEVAATVAPKLDVVLIARVRVRLARGEFDLAARDATTLVTLAPHLSEAYLLRAEARERTDDLPGFLADAERASALERRSARSERTRGRALLASGRAAEAEEVFTRVIALEPAVGDAWFGRAQARVILGRPAEGLADALRARALEPDEPEADLLCAEARARSGDHPGAIVDLERYLSRAAPDEPGLARARELLRALRP